MAESPAHRFGQILGEVLEAAVASVLEPFARKQGLYLDRQGERPCRRGKKCSWKDLNGNKHDLDFVLERSGTPDRVGTPIAFIETAWRRYTKHSRNKSQEIQGAIEPLAETYHHSKPFKGAVLAGVFTEGALTQLRSLGFTVVYISYAQVVAVFRKSGMDAAFNEDTSDAQFRAKVKAYERLSPLQKKRLSAAMIAAARTEVNQFVDSLLASVSRRIERVIILILHGQPREATTAAGAIQLIEAYADRGIQNPIERYEIEIRYNNGDSIHARFRDKIAAIEFLRNY